MAKQVIVKYIRDDGKEFIIDGTLFGIPNDGIEGVDFAEWNVYKENLALKDGCTITGKSYSGRPITIKFRNKIISNMDADRDNARRFFNPKHEFKLYITYRGITRWIDGVIDGVNIPTGNIYEPPEYKIGLYCADPFFKSTDSFGKDIAEVSPMWGWPWICTDEIKPVFSVFNYDPYIYIENDGDESAPLIARLTFDGPVTDPKIIQGYNEKYFQLNGTFTSDDILVIDFENGIVLRNGVKAFNLVNKNSQDLDIPIGLTLYSMGCSDPDDTILMHCYLSFYKRYGGI